MKDKDIKKSGVKSKAFQISIYELKTLFYFYLINYNFSIINSSIY